MSHITLAQQGLAAAEARNWDEAITKLSKALQVSPNPAWLLARSRALVNACRYEDALDDANLAWHTAYDRNKRPLMADAHYRRAVAYFRMGQHANADCCCLYAMRLIKGEAAVAKEDPAVKWTDDEGFWTATVAEVTAEANTDVINKGQGGGMAMAMGGKEVSQAKEWRMASTLRMQILGAMEKLPANDPARKLTTTLKPPQKKLSDIKTESEAKANTPAATSTLAARPAVPADTPMRLQEFQNSKTMSVSIFSKGVNKEKLQVGFLSSGVWLNPLVYPNGDEKEFHLDLWGPIDGAASKYTVTANKVELSLVKASAGKWPQLKKDVAQKFAGQDAAESKEQQELEAMKQARKVAMDSAENRPAPKAESEPTDKSEAGKSAPGPAYPSSSRTGPKDWDKIGDDADEGEDGKDVNYFFKHLYKNASPEQQRAMMKSFTESNGTSLSTDWNDVKARKVETVPPEGVEAKEWE